jgi:hypothetical protein
MTEKEWLECADPTPMLEFLRGKASDRKLRLFAVACCRSVWVSLPISTKGAVQVAERFIEAETTSQEFRVDLFTQAAQSAGQERDLLLGLAYYQGTIWRPDHVTAVRGLVAGCAMLQSPASVSNRQNRQASLVRDVFNPFRPVAINPAWRISNVMALAQSIYDERAFERLPILADALEDAGCDNQDILQHCRSGGEHVRGCWVVDLVLAKE